MKTEVWLAFIFGVVFLLLSLFFAVFAFYLPKPENPEFVGNFLFVMQVVLATAASGVAAVIPGFLNVILQRKLGKRGTIGIRAGGAIAVFVLVFVVNPRSLALDQMNKRVGFNERLEKCRSYIPAIGSPLSGAVQYCLEARDFDPTRWEAHRQLARAYLGLEQYEQSIASYKEAIRLMTGINYDKIIRMEDVNSEFKHDFLLMAWGIAIGQYAFATIKAEDVKTKVYGYRQSLAAIEKARWIANKEASASGDQLLNDLLYLKAVDDAYLWLVEDVNGLQKEQFDNAVSELKDFSKLPGATPQWAEYHLSCLFSEGARRFKDSNSEFYFQQAKIFIVSAMMELRRTQVDTSPIQDKQMRCRLLTPMDCKVSSISDPIVCESLAELVTSNPELKTLAEKI